MRTVKLSAGDIIEAMCTRCRSILNHTIVAMVEDRVVRVECNTCHGVHNYRGKTEKKDSPTAPSGREKQKTSRQTKTDAGKEPKITDRQEWESHCSGNQADRSTPYDMNGKFKVDDLVDHSTFGVGIVRALIPPNKMEVLFESGKKLLRCHAM